MKRLGLALLLPLAGCGPYNKAVQSEDAAAVRAQLEAGKDPNKADAWSGFLPLQMATTPEIVDLLVDHGAKVDLRGDDNPVMTALEYERWAAARRMVERGAFVPADWAKHAQDAPADLRQLLTRAREKVPPPQRPQPGNLDDDAYARMRASAGMAPEKKASAVDQPSYSSAERPKDFAVVVGVESYEKLPKASHALSDAQAVRRHLRALGLPERNIVFLSGQNATKSKLVAYFEEWLPKNVGPDSRLFVYYSGHGAPDPKSGQAYLVPWDGDPAFLKSTGYPLKSLYAQLAALPAKSVVVALDACFSGAGGRSVLAAGARPLVTSAEDLKPAAKLTVLAAASGDEITGALDEEGHGMFTYFLLKGLGAGKRSARQLHDYLKPQVQDEARRQNREQTPVLLGEDASL